MQVEKLRSLIRESINEYIREVENQGNIAAQEAKIDACKEAVAIREKKINMEGLDESFHDLISEEKLKELKNEIKALKNYEKKATKVLDKMKAKKDSSEKKEKVVTDSMTEDAPIDENDALSDEEKEELRKKAEQNPSLALPEGKINESFLKMQKLAGVITEAQYNLKKKVLVEDQLNEDILELKQMSKQLYSFLKQKGFPVTLENKLRQPINPLNPKSGTITTSKSQVTSDINVEPVQIIVEEGKNEMVTVAISPSNVARILVGKGDDWTHKARQKFGDDWGKWQKNQEIVQYVNKLGNELLAEIKGKYPNMIYKFEQQEFIYLLRFGYGQTKKGGQFNPNDSKNKLA
jgi:hypothetical protein